MTLGNRLYDMRKAKGLSQERVAEILGVTRQTVSKWETDQSTPDFDKIIPLCELYEISTEELLKGEKQSSYASYPESSLDDRFNSCVAESNESDDSEVKPNNSRRKFAILISMAVCMYILSVVPIIIGNGSIASVAVFFVIIALASMLIVFGVLSKPKAENDDVKVITKQKKLYKQITGILSGITLCIYLLISFLTNDWHITWLIWIIYGIICKIIDLILTLKESENSGKE